RQSEIARDFHAGPPRARYVLEEAGSGRRLHEENVVAHIGQKSYDIQVGALARLEVDAGLVVEHLHRFERRIGAECEGERAGRGGVGAGKLERGGRTKAGVEGRVPAEGAGDLVVETDLRRGAPVAARPAVLRRAQVGDGNAHVVAAQRGGEP